MVELLIDYPQYLKVNYHNLEIFVSNLRILDQIIKDNIHRAQLPTQPSSFFHIHLVSFLKLRLLTYGLLNVSPFK